MGLGVSFTSRKPMNMKHIHQPHGRTRIHTCMTSIISISTGSKRTLPASRRRIHICMAGLKHIHGHTPDMHHQHRH